jgi:prevent-host-death family protein
MYAVFAGAKKTALRVLFKPRLFKPLVYLCRSAFIFLAGAYAGNRPLDSALKWCYSVGMRRFIMPVKFSEDVVPLTDIKINPGKVVRHTGESHRPVLLTSRGRGVAVIQSLEDYEKAEEEKVFMRAVVEGMGDLESDRHASLEDVKNRLGIE